jgi:hypothetical protein
MPNHRLYQKDLKRIAIIWKMMYNN